MLRFSVPGRPLHCVQGDACDGTINFLAGPVRIPLGQGQYQVVEQVSVYADLIELKVTFSDPETFKVTHTFPLTFCVQEQEQEQKEQKFVHISISWTNGDPPVTYLLPKEAFQPEDFTKGAKYAFMNPEGDEFNVNLNYDEEEEEEHTRAAREFFLKVWNELEDSMIQRGPLPPCHVGAFWVFHVLQ